MKLMHLLKSNILEAEDGSVYDADKKQLKMPPFMKQLLLDLGRVVPWPFTMMETNNSKSIWFQARGWPKGTAHDKNVSSQGSEYVNVTYKIWSDQTGPQLTVTTKGKHNDAVIEVVKEYQKDHLIHGTASYPGYTTGF